jgi:hypothetical protein
VTRKANPTGESDYHDGYDISLSPITYQVEIALETGKFGGSKVFSQHLRTKEFDIQDTKSLSRLGPADDPWIVERIVGSLGFGLEHFI